MKYTYKDNTYTVPTWDKPVWEEPWTPINPTPGSSPNIWNYGWKCPNCGRGNAPWSSTCPCIPVPSTITC